MMSAFKLGRYRFAMVETSWRATTISRAEVYGLRYVRSSLISIQQARPYRRLRAMAASSFESSRTYGQRDPVDPRDGKGARHRAHLSFEDPAQEIRASQGMRAMPLVARPNQCALERRLG